MSDKDTGGFAFPSGPEVPSQFSGMKLRDWFAGQALVAMMGGAQNPEQAAFFAYQVADAMLKERK